MMKKTETQKHTYNMTFGLLSGFAIIMVVAGHLGYDLMAAGGLCMMIPGELTDVIGVVLVVGIIVVQRMSAKKSALA